MGTLSCRNHYSLMRINALAVCNVKWLVVTKITAYLIPPNLGSRFLIFIPQEKRFLIPARNAMKPGV
jgi:hypothetical protein